MTTNDLLLEIGTEELPPKALLTLAQAFENGMRDAMQEQQLTFSKLQGFATPRRLAVLFSDLSGEQPDRNVEKLGPNVKAAFDKDGNPSKAALGFAGGLGVSVDDLGRKDTDKGERLAYSFTEKGKPLQALLQGMVDSVLASLPIPKRMRWGDSRSEFIRPVQWLTVLYGDEVLPLDVYGNQAGSESYGHRFHSEGPIKISKASDYENTLENNGRVIVDFAKRRKLIEKQLQDVATKTNAEVVISESLLDEVCGLVEWPVALMGNFDESFLRLPQESLISSMREHQKYFHLVDANGKLLPHFITLSNIESKDPQQVVEGNERVIRPRLADAQFFYDTDRKTPLSDRVERLKKVVFQEKLGSIHDKCERIAALANYIGEQLDFDKQHISQGALLCKADLVSEMVGEFGDLQGIIGRYYAQADGLDDELAVAIEEHYLPRFAGDKLPSNPTAMALSLADRIDTIVGIFGIGQAPTGSRDPFALRRAALGVLRVIIEKELALDLKPLMAFAAKQHAQLSESDADEQALSYVMERLRAWYSDQNIVTEHFMAVHAQGISEPLDFEKRVKAVADFAASSSAPALASANKRVANILAKQDQAAIKDSVDAGLLQDEAEKVLAEAVSKCKTTIAPMLLSQDYAQALNELAHLKDPVDQFFDQVMVMADDPALQANRVALLKQLRDQFLLIADISLLAQN
jgi:glycyl-tRNA synthetase beta chain